jgi:hypothetical protein
MTKRETLKHQRACLKLARYYFNEFEKSTRDSFSSIFISNATYNAGYEIKEVKKYLKTIHNYYKKTWKNV